MFVFGYGLGGSYATWLRQKYPFLVNGAIAWNAPLRASVDFGEYLLDAAHTVGRETPECGEIFLNGFSELDELIDNGEGAHLQELFNLNETLATDNALDVASFVSGLARTFAIYVATSK